MFQGTFDLKSVNWSQSNARKISSEQINALQTSYDDNFAKHMIVATNPAQAPEDFTGSVFSSE